jgi:glycosyltransferase involved in cell wall biosynthesis
VQAGPRERLHRAGATARRRVAVSVQILRHARRGAPPTGDAAPLVTVVIPTYNWSSVLRHAIRSALWQTHRNLELIVVGDACTDDSEAVVASFRDSRVRWINLSVNSGAQSAPNNAGIAAARGAYIAYLGHDDLWHPSHLAHVLNACLAGADLAYSLTEVMGPPGSNVRVLAGLSPTSSYQPGRWLPSSALIHRRSMVDRVGGWRDYRTLEISHDVEFVRRAHDHGARFARVPALTVFKFTAGWRPDSYRRRPSHEQARYLRRIEHERAFIVRELAAIAALRLLPLPRRLPPGPDPRRRGELGWEVAHSRRVRGLE